MSIWTFMSRGEYEAIFMLWGEDIVLAQSVIVDIIKRYNRYKEGR